MGEFVGFKCVFLTSGKTEVEKERVHSLVNSCGHSLESRKCFITDSRWLQCFQYPSEEFEKSTASLAGLREIEASPGKPHLFVINPHPQHAIHDPLLISSEGVYVIFCDNGEEEEKMVYLRRVLDRIVEKSSSDCKSFVYIRGIDKKSRDKITESYRGHDEVSLNFVPDEENFDLVSDLCQKCYRIRKLETHTALCKAFKRLSDSKKVILLKEWIQRGDPNTDGGKGDQYILETLRSLGIIFFVRLNKGSAGNNDIESNNLIFTRPEALHEILCKVLPDRDCYPGGMQVECLIGQVRSKYFSFDDKIEDSFERLLLQLKLLIKAPHGGKVLLHSLCDRPVEDCDKASSSVSALIVKFVEKGCVSEIFFVELAGKIFNYLFDLHERKQCRTGKVTLHYVEFVIQCYHLHMYRRNNASIEFRFRINDFGSRRMDQKTKSACVKKCQDVKQAVYKSLKLMTQQVDSEYKCYGEYAFGFMCSSENGSEEFACYDPKTPAMLCGYGKPFQMFWCQKIWFESPPHPFQLPIKSVQCQNNEYRLEVMKEYRVIDSVAKSAPFNREAFMEKYRDRFMKYVPAKDVALKWELYDIINENTCAEIKRALPGEQSGILFKYIRTHGSLATVRKMCDFMIETGKGGYSNMKALGEEMKEDLKQC